MEKQFYVLLKGPPPLFKALFPTLVMASEAAERLLKEGTRKETYIILETSRQVSLPFTPLWED